MIRINLLPIREARRKAVVRHQGILIGAAVAVGVLIAGGLHLMEQARISATRSAIAETEAEFRKLEATLKKIEQYKQRKEEIQRKLVVIADLEKARIGPVRIMDEIATRIPDRMWLDRMSLKGGLLDLGGYALDNEIIAAFMTSLEESEFITNIVLVEAQLQEHEGLKLNKFTVRARDTRSIQVASAGERTPGR
jgi:type IV pilus assembly protein PilN